MTSSKETRWRQRFDNLNRAFALLAGLVDRLRQDSGRFGLGPAQLEEIIGVIASVDRVERAVVFGSRAMGTHKPGSDVDICVFGRELDGEAVSELSRRLNNETTTAFVIDVLGYAAIDSPSLRHHIDQEGAVIFDRYPET